MFAKLKDIRKAFSKIPRTEPVVQKEKKYNYERKHNDFIIA